VESFAKANRGRIVAAYTEIESGKRADGPQLTEALSHARLAKATLVVAKLDRLARNVAFLAALIESGVDFVACDNQHANKLTLHILAAVAQAEREAASQRTKDAFRAAKRNGAKLGSNRRGHWTGREEGSDSISATAGFRDATAALCRRGSVVNQLPAWNCPANQAPKIQIGDSGGAKTCHRGEPGGG
jgi:DNA invertase Pin-like site-specific DNA recombinase